jgi:hypothetical protein
MLFVSWVQRADLVLSDFGVLPALFLGNEVCEQLALLVKFHLNKSVKYLLACQPSWHSNLVAQQPDLISRSLEP